MIRVTRFVLLASVLLGACSGDDDYNYVGPAPGSQALVQVLNASPDAPPMTLLIDGAQAAPTLGYGEGTGELYLDPTVSHSITLQGLSPTTPTTLVSLTSKTFTAGTVYRIIAEGPLATVAPVTYTYAAATTPANSTRLQFVHAAPAAASLAIYVTAPGAALASSTPFATLAYQQAAGPSALTSGNYEIRITPAGATSPVLYDSGSLTLAPGTNLLIAAVANVGLGSASVQLVAVDQDGDNTFLADVSTPAALRVVHDIANGPVISVYTNGSTTPLVSSLAYGAATAYLPVAAQSLSVSVTPMSNPSQSLLSLDLNLEAGSEHTLYAVGPLASAQPLVTHDHARRVASYAKLRLINGAPSAGVVDMYVVATGTSIAAVTPSYAGVPLGGDTDFQPFTAGTYALTITAANSKTPLVGPVSLTLSNSGIYTAVARDASGGGTPIGLIELDDL